MLKRFKKYFISNYEKFKLSISLALGITAIIFLVFYLIGCYLDLWTYNIIDLVFNPVAASIIVVVPVFAVIVILRFYNCYMTRSLFYRIIKTHRRKITFTLQEDTGGNPECEVRYKLKGNYRESTFRFAYSMGHPLMISLIAGKNDHDLFDVNKLFKKNNLSSRHFNNHGLTTVVRNPLTENSIESIPDRLDQLLSDYNTHITNAKHKS